MTEATAAGCPVLMFLPRGAVFEPDEVTTMGRAFDLACNVLAGASRSESARETLAARIIVLAARTRSDADVLCDATLAAMARSQQLHALHRNLARRLAADRMAASRPA